MPSESVSVSDGIFPINTMNTHSVPAPGVSILGMGYLGRPLAQKFYENGSRVAAIKRSYTSDDVNLPITLDAVDLNRADAFRNECWQHHLDKPVWICLLPPSALDHYADTIGRWTTLAETSGVQHLIFTSSTSVYGEQIRECDETTPPDPQTESAHRILAVEKRLLESSVPHVDILRLGGLYCAERHPVSRLLEKQNIPGGNRPVNIVHRDLAVDALFQTAFDPKGKRIRNIVEARHPTRREFYTEEAAKLGLPAPDFASGGAEGGKVVNTVCADGLSL